MKGFVRTKINTFNYFNMKKLNPKFKKRVKSSKLNWDKYL